MKKITLAAVVIASLVGSSASFAGGTGWYALGSVGQTTSNNSDKAQLDSVITGLGGVGFSSSLSTPTAYRLQAGYQVNDNFAVEGGYLGLTNSSYSASGGNIIGSITASGKADGWNLTAVGIVPVAEQFSLLGKLGAANISTTATVTAGGASLSTSGSKTDLTYGIGAKYDINKAVFARFDLDNFKGGANGSYSRKTIWTFGLGYNF